MTNSDNTFGTYNKITKIYRQYILYHINKAGQKITYHAGWGEGIIDPYIRVVSADDDTIMDGTITDDTVYMQKGPIQAVHPNPDNEWVTPADLNPSGDPDYGLLKKYNQEVKKETESNNFADVAEAKAKLLSPKGVAVWEDNATNIQWALTESNNALKVTADFGIPTDPSAKPWAEKFKEEYNAISTPDKVNDTGLFNKACDVTTWGDVSAELAIEGCDPIQANPVEYAGGSRAPEGNDGKVSSVEELDSSDHLF